MTATSRTAPTLPLPEPSLPQLLPRTKFTVTPWGTDA